MRRPPRTIRPGWLPPTNPNTLRLIAIIVIASLAGLEGAAAEVGTTPVPLPTGARDPAVMEARRLLQAEIAKIDPSQSIHVGAAYVDLDGVGSPELIAQIESYDTCGSAGCSTWVFRKEGAVWAPLVNGAIAGSIKVYDRREDQPAGTPRDLLLTSKELWRWGSGKGYTRIGFAP
ncbi:hypothetical protein [Azospirillum sp. sgz301742]